MITSEELTERYSPHQTAPTSNASPHQSMLVQRGTLRPAASLQSPPQTTPTTPHAVTRIVSRKLPHPPHYKPPTTVVPPTSSVSGPTITAAAASQTPTFTIDQDTIPRSLAFKFMRWMRLGQDVIHIEEEEGDKQQEQSLTSDTPKQAFAPDDLLAAEITSMLNTSTVQTDGEVEHAAVREAAASSKDAPLEDVVKETKNRWRSFGRRAVAKSVLPLIEYSGLSALKTFKQKDAMATEPSVSNSEPAKLDYDPEQIENSIDLLLEDDKKSRRVSKRSLLKGSSKHTKSADKEAGISDGDQYVTAIEKLYGVDHQKAVDMVHTAVEAAKADPKGPKIVELHKKDIGNEVFGVKIQVEGGPAISFAPSDLHSRLKPYFSMVN